MRDVADLAVKHRGSEPQPPGLCQHLADAGKSLTQVDGRKFVSEQTPGTELR